MINSELAGFLEKENEKQEKYEIKLDCSLSELSSFRVGGIASCVIYPLTVTSLKLLLGFMLSHGIEFRVIGNGTNLIPLDNGISKVLVVTKKICELCIEGQTVYAGCGVGLSKLAGIVADVSLSGMENLYGIPATVGGAVYMNAGAYGSKISDILVSAECYNCKTGEIETFDNEQMSFSYRHSKCKEEKLILLSAVFKLCFGDENEIKSRMKEVIVKRKSTQPLEYPNAGSIFKRPENNYAGKLIEEAGLKGLCIGGAEVSVKHAGFIVNKGGATAADILALINVIKAKVFEINGVMLQCEVELL